MPHPSIAVIPTPYAGVRFRSRSEARWAVFFDALHLEWTWEPEAYQTHAGRYQPDFWVENLYVDRGDEHALLRGAFVEVKGAPPTPHEHQLALDLCHATAKPVLILEGQPGRDPAVFLYVPGEDWPRRQSTFHVCANCEAVTVAHAEFFETCPCTCADRSPLLLGRAESAATSFRFVYGASA